MTDSDRNQRWREGGKREREGERVWFRWDFIKARFQEKQLERQHTFDQENSGFYMQRTEECGMIQHSLHRLKFTLSDGQTDPDDNGDLIRS